MVATRAQRAQTKDEPVSTTRGALKEPARRGKKKADIEEPVPAPAPKPTRAATTKKAAKPATSTATTIAPATRRTRAKDVEAPAPEEPAEEPGSADESEIEVALPAPAPAKTARKTATNPPPKTTTTTTRKRPAKDFEPDTARPAKRQTRSRATVEPGETEPAAKRATRATRGTKSSDSRSTATVKPLAQRIHVTAKKPTRETKEDISEPAAPEVEMEDVIDVQAPPPPRSTRKASKKAASEEPEQPTAPEAEPPVEPTPAKSAKKSSKKAALEEVPEAPVEHAQTETHEEPAPTTPIKSKEERQPEQPVDVPEAERAVPEEPCATTPVQTPEAVLQQPKTPAKQTPIPPKQVRTETKENVAPKTPGPAHYTEALPFAQEATPFFKPGKTPMTASLQARTPGLSKSLFHETPRKGPMATPFKLAPMSAAKLNNPETNTGSILNTPAKRAPFATSRHGMTPMRPSAAKPDFKASSLQTPAKKGLMLPPSTAPVNKTGFQPTHAKSSLLQTCPRKIALPGLPPKSSTVSPSKPGESMMGSSLLSATPRKVRIEPPTQPAFGSSVQDFAFQPQNSVLGAEPRRWNTPARTPAKRFATPGKTPAKSLVDADAGSPTPVKKTPAGLKDVNSALKLLKGASPAMPPTTPTEQFVLNVIDKIDQSMSESESAQEEASSSQTEEVEVARSVDESDSQHDQDDITFDLELQRPAAEETEQCVFPADLVMSESGTPAGSPAPAHVDEAMMDEQAEAPAPEEAADADQSDAEESVQHVPQMEAIAEEESVLEQHDEYVEVTPARPEIEFIEESHDVEMEEELDPTQSGLEVTAAIEDQVEDEEVQEEHSMETTMVAEEVVEEIHDPVVSQTPERPSTPTMEDQDIAALAKEKAKTERRVRSKRLSMAIELENSIKKPRKSLAFIPSLTPAKSSLRSPFKRPFGSPKKSVAWAVESVQAQPRFIEKPKVLEQPRVIEEHAEDFEVSIPRPDDLLLNHTVFFVDVRAADSEDAGDLFIPLLEEMGAKVVSSWSGVDAGVTHVLYKDGAIETLEKVAATKGTVKAVNIGWVLDCERFNKWVPEADYLVEVSRLTGCSSPARALTTLSTNPNTPARATPGKSAFGTPFALMQLTPKARPSLSPFADITPAALSSPENKENTTPKQEFKTPTKASPSLTVAGEFSPSTPYYLHPQNLVQKTCPPKQSNKGLFDRDVRGASEMAVTPFRQKMLLARRSMSPAAFGRAVDM